MMLSKQRNVLKGFAILWVIFFHASLNLTGSLSLFQQMGYGGVDIFLFLSGYGLYHSLSKSADLSAYLKRRAKRLLPSYLPFCLLWLLIMIPMYEPSLVMMIRSIVGNLSMLGFWADVQPLINWYPGGLLLTILLAPLAFAGITKSQKPHQAVLLMMIVSFLVGLCFVDHPHYMAISRIPVFLLGMGFAIPRKNEKPVWMSRLALIIAFVIGLFVLLTCITRFQELLMPYGMYWHPFVLITPPLCLGLAWIATKTAVFSLLWKTLSYLGVASFEIFLFNAWAEVLGKHFDLFTTPTQWLLASIASIVCGCVYHKIIRK